MIDIFHPFAEIDRLNVELELARDGACVAMTQCSNAQALITELRAELSQARAWAAAWKRRASYYRIRYKQTSRKLLKWVARCGDVYGKAESELRYLRRELVLAVIGQQCGHTLRLVATDGDRDNYCQACADSGAVEAQLRTELAQARSDIKMLHICGDGILAERDNLRVAIELMRQQAIDVVAGKNKAIDRKDAALATIGEHLPLHDIDEYGYHSPGCDTCAIQAELEKAA